MCHQIFISYQTESLEFVKTLCEKLESHGIKCWYGARDIEMNHAAEIPKAIETCKIFLLVVDDNVSSNPRPDILNEVYLACECFKRGALNMITINKTRDEYQNSELLYHLGRLQKKFLIDDIIADEEAKFLSFLSTIYSILEHMNGINTPNDSHYKNDYFDITDEKERQRLTIQHKLFKNFDDDVYEKILSDRQNLNILDIGCNEGYLTIDRFGDKGNKIIGIDINKDAIKEANRKHGSKAEFYNLNCEDKYFSKKLRVIMNTNNIQNFDIIHISMLLLHLDNPEKLLRKCKNFITDNGYLFVRDIDDTITFVNPDPNGYFRRLIQICANESLSGYRNSGTGIYSMLVKCGYKNVKLEKKGLDTSSMGTEDKDALFQTYFSFIYNDTMQLYQQNKNDKQINDDYLWLKENYETIKKQYNESNTLFQLGFMTYTAQNISPK